MKQLEPILYMAILGLFGLFGIYLQDTLLEDPPEQQTVDSRQAPDYYIENFTATGLDKNGQRKFIIEAQRMTHFPDDTALFDYPHVIEYEVGQAPRHTYSDSGWMSSNGNEILLTDNVKVVIEALGDKPSSTMRTRKMRILLDKSAKKSLL